MVRPSVVAGRIEVRRVSFRPLSALPARDGRVRFQPMDPVSRARLGGTDLQVTRLGLGLAPIGGLYSAVPDEQARATIDRAWQHGVRLFDTAPLYGYGRSERLAGAALAGRPRAEFVLSTKVGRVLRPGDGDAGQDIWADPPAGVTPEWDFSYEGVLRSVADSRQRLGLDRLDVLHLHDPENFYSDAVGGGYRALDELRGSGAVGAVSVGTNRVDLLGRFAAAGRFDCFLIAGRYTLLDQSAAAEALPMCADRGIGVLAAGVFNSGLLADPRPGARFDYAPADRDRLDRAVALRQVCDRYGVPLPAAAIQFTLAHPAVTAVVVGVRTPSEVDDAVAGVRQEIPAGLWAELRAERLLPAGLPTP
jgi:D-threo-aldose 1-dehydrogenase